MTKTVIEMAREAGLGFYRLRESDNTSVDALERFAALVREDDRETQQEKIALANKIRPRGKSEAPYMITAALAARKMRDAAVKVCIESLTDEVRDNGCEWIVDEIKNKIAALPIIGEDK